MLRLAFSLLLLLTAAPALVPASEAAADDPKVYAVVFYADWCSHCQILDPKVAEAWLSVAGQPIELVTLDFTNRATSDASEARAAALGLGTAIADDSGRTGFMVLYDAVTKREIGRVGSRATVAQIRETLRAALGGA